jgi:SAM-dependent methyltransferase
VDIVVRVQEMLASFRQAGLKYLDYLSSKAAASDEAVVRLKIIEPLLAALGYDLQADLDPEHRVQEGAIDILVRANGIPVMLWELKRTQETDLAQHEGQLTRYALAKGVTHAVLCNGREVRVYHRVGEVLRFAYTFPLIAFAPGALVPPTENEKLALSTFFDAFRKEAFLEAERMKEEIAATTAHPLILSPDHPQNETVLVRDLKREIRHLHRFVLLRFRSHRALHRAFLEEKEQRESQAAQAHEKLWGAVENFEGRSRVHADRGVVEAYLTDFTERWTAVEEHQFVEEFIGNSGLAQYLKGANSVTFRLRAQEFYRAYTDLARWHAKQLVELRPTLLLMQDFDHWQDEIGLMAEDYEAEFCLQTVYIFVTRLLLIRICEDKGLITQKISDGGYKDYLDFGRRFFTNIADAHATLLEIAYKDTGYIYGHFFSRDIFDWYTWEEEAIVRLFWVLNRFDFAQVSADLIGHIYEQYVDELERKRKGQFYTPPQVVNYILDQVGYQGPEIVGKRVLDPACGSGRFLVEAARRLIPELKKQPGLSSKELVNERLRNALFGLDINRFACFLAEVNLLVQVLDLLKDGPAFTIERFHIYPTNTLLPREQEGWVLVGPSNGLVYETEVAELIKGRGYNPALGLDFGVGFDWVVGNPPYVRADSPGVGTLRSRIEASGRYRTLYKKWDLYIPFIEFAMQMMAEGGRHGFIVSDAYQTEEYARQSRAKLLAETTIESLTFAPKVSFFEEAQVHNLIYAVHKGELPSRQRVKRYKAVAPALRSKDLKTLPALSQAKWGEQIFRPEFKGEEGLDFSGCLRLGEICYVGYGLAPVSHEDLDPIVDGKRRKLFVTDDLLSDVHDQIHPKRFVQGKDIDRFRVVRLRWLEWNTARVPSQLRRKKFTELFENEKLIVARRPQQGSLKAIYDERGEFYCDATAICAVLAHELANVHNRTLDRRKVRASLLQAAQNSPHYNLAYLTALINCRWLSGYLFKIIGTGKVDFYPDDLKQYPIPPADAETQAEIARLVKEIMDAKADVQRWREQGHCIDEKGIVLSPRPFLDIWAIPHGDLIDASGFITRQIGGYPTTLSLEGQRLTFRKQPLSYFESDHPEALDYLKLYIETNRDDLRARPVADLSRLIRIPKSPQAVQDFLVRLESEREQMMLRWMVAAQHESLIEEWAFDLYDVDDAQREKLSGKLYTFDNVPASVAFVSILDNEQDNPMHRLAFPKDGGWHYRAPEPLPHAVLLWMCDGSTVTTEWRAV